MSPNVIVKLLMDAVAAGVVSFLEEDDTQLKVRLNGCETRLIVI